MSTSRAALEHQELSEALYTGHHERIERLCRLILADTDLAQEVSQDVFLKLHIQLDIDTQAAVDWPRWLTTVAVNACRDVRRGRWWRDWFQQRDAVDEEAVGCPGAGPEVAVISRRARLEIHGAYAKLPTRQREVFALRHFEGWSTEETAELLGLSTGTVKKHLFRAVARMRRALGGER